MEIFKKINNFNDIIGQEETKKQLRSALITDRHIILVGPPGIGKTTLAKNVAKLLPEIEANKCPYNCDPKEPICPECKSKKKTETKKIPGLKRFIRIQGSPDLTVEDLIGDIDPIKALQFGPLSIEAFTPGKIFRANRGVLFFDEINRCPEKLQNSLLQVLEEGRATIGSYDVELPADFIFIGTANPEDFAGTERLSDVFLDRFDIIYMTYPQTEQIEKEIVKTKAKALKEIKFPEDLLDLTINFIRLLRENPDLERAPSVRATIGLFERAQANALIAGRSTVNPKDIKEAIISVVSHRIKLKPSIRYKVKPDDLLKEEFEKFLKEKEGDELKEESGDSL